jgi:hypothetical protein
MVELLIVIAIIASLMALGAAVYNAVTTAQQKTVSEQAIQKLLTQLDSQWKAVIDSARNDESIPAQVLANAGNDPRLAQAYYLNLRLQQEFPMDYNEARLFIPNGPPARQAYLNAVGALPAASDQSSACLYLALKQNRRGMNFDPDTALSSQSVRLRPDGLKEIVDGWGRPLKFNRFSVPPVSNAQAKLNALAGLSGTATTLAVTSAAPFPAAAPFHILIDSENMLVTSVSGTTFTVARDLPPVATSHLNGATVTYYGESVLVGAMSGAPPNLPYEVPDTLVVASASPFPLTPLFRVRILDIDNTTVPPTDNSETVLVTGVSGTTFTVTRFPFYDANAQRYLKPHLSGKPVRFEPSASYEINSPGRDGVRSSRDDILSTTLR